MTIKESIEKLELLVEDCASDGEKEAFDVVKQALNIAATYIKSLQKE